MGSDTSTSRKQRRELLLSEHDRRKRGTPRAGPEANTGALACRALAGELMVAAVPPQIAQPVIAARQPILIPMLAADLFHPLQPFLGGLEAASADFRPGQSIVAHVAALKVRHLGEDFLELVGVVPLG